MSDPTHGRGCDCRRCVNRRNRTRAANARRTPQRYIPAITGPTAPIRTYSPHHDALIARAADAMYPGEQLKGKAL